MRDRIGLAIFALLSYLAIGFVFYSYSGSYEAFGEKIVIVALITIACLCMVYEMFSKGIGVIGIVGFLSFGAFFFLQLSNEYTSVGSLIIFMSGILLMLIELFVPGAIVGILGFVACIWGFVEAINDVTLALLTLATAFLSSGILFYYMKSVKKKDIRIYQSFVLKDKVTTEEGYVSNVTRTDLIGKRGKSITLLRPAGTVVIENERLDVVTLGDFIEQGKQVEVVEVEGVRIVVKEVSE